MERQELWYCKFHHMNFPARLTANDKALVVRFRPEFTGVLLMCRHWVRVRQDKVQ